MSEPAKTRTHTWVINLDRSPDRLASISAQLDGLGLAWTRQRIDELKQLGIETFLRKPFGAQEIGVSIGKAVGRRL